ncbi:hypothetical protein AGABI2DRAFT_154368 [Agaricus bisporus var. bisporus H97]|uniref:hypothetical protein n=1 Tax=Agaricus bisporus var. bisporus (strain H97 / ATCC MYA-4626 / FGSC 10389) TaxID=936046 RepID=UPI00029F5ADB|nr:hypothetical protein AGABI2DRAFT_154368 [Agaricus bisporus var. bisporus H97]EKV42573.1 hypothetical protein AGABI2DRAFT_154368 [Agaricus bisporus var. bisporus H97]
MDTPLITIQRGTGSQNCSKLPTTLVFGQEDSCRLNGVISIESWSLFLNDGIAK